VFGRAGLIFVPSTTRVCLLVWRKSRVKSARGDRGLACIWKIGPAVSAHCTVRTAQWVGLCVVFRHTPRLCDPAERGEKGEPTLPEERGTESSPVPGCPSNQPGTEQLFRIATTLLPGKKPSTSPQNSVRRRVKRDRATKWRPAPHRQWPRAVRRTPPWIRQPQNTTSASRAGHWILPRATGTRGTPAAATPIQTTTTTTTTPTRRVLAICAQTCRGSR